MVEIRSFAELLADLGRLSSSFRSLISYAGEDSIKHWYRLRNDGNTILNHMRYHSAIDRLGLFQSIPKFESLGFNGASPSVCYLAIDALFKGLVGFELEPRYKSFKADFPYFFDDGSTLTRELCLFPGLIFQPVIAVDPDMASDPAKLWSIHRFELLDRCARGCEMLIEIIEKEMALQKQVDADDGNRHDVLADGLSTDKRSFRWHGKTYNLGLVSSKVVELLHNRYLDGEYFVHEQFIKTECEVGSDMRHIVRDNHLEDLIVRQKKPNGKPTNGMWGLNPN